MSTAGKKSFSFRAFVSVMMGLSFLGMAFSGIILFVTPPGRFANWTGWRLIGLTKNQWSALHIWFSLLFMAASILHIYLNWRALTSYFKSKVTRHLALRTEWLVSIVLFGIVLGGTLMDVKPFSSLMAWNENIKQSWETRQQQAPIPHAELLSIKELADEIKDMDVQTLLANLKAQGIVPDSEDVIVGDLARANQITPAQLHQTAIGQTTQGPGRYGRGAGVNAGTGQSGQGRGMGRMTLKEYCDEQGLDINKAIEKLNQANMNADENATIRDIADKAGIHPSEIKNILE